MASSIGCGCKICKLELGEFTNDLIINGESPKSVLEILQQKTNLKISPTLLKKHLSAFGIDYPEKEKTNVKLRAPIKVDLNKIDFSEYDFDENQPESIIAYLQKINLKIYLNQSQITLQAQQDVIDGKCPDVPKEIMQNLAVAFQILDKSTGLSIHVNQQEAIKTVESMGLSVQNKSSIYLSPNVSNQTESETN